MSDPRPDDKTQVLARAPDVDLGAPVTTAPESAAQALAVGTRVGEFEVTGIIGAGGFGIVYLAQDLSLGRQVALKEYMPTALAMRGAGGGVELKSPRDADTFLLGLRSFVNEARLLAQFDHPSLVKVYRFWEANGTAYMVMPFYEGITLKQALRQAPAKPDEAWLQTLLNELLNALEIIHAAQCYHRDIAPDNILLLPSGRPVLLDFGAARRVLGDSSQALTVILKPGYAPLEQYADMPDVKQGAFTDIYALAAVVYCAVTGRPPAPSVARLMTDTVVPLAQLARDRYSDTFLRAIDRALAVKPADRPQTVAEFRQLLRAAGAGAAEGPGRLGQAGEGLSAVARRALESRLRPQAVEPHSLVFASGAADADLVIVETGHVLLATAWPPEAGLELALMGPGMAFGEVAFLNGMPRTAFAGTEDEPALLWRLSRADFDAWVQTHPHDGVVFMGKIAQMGTWRLGATTRQLRGALE